MNEITFNIISKLILLLFFAGLFIFVIYPIITNKSVRKKSTALKYYDSYTIGKITDASLFQLHNQTATVSYIVNNKTYQVMLNGSSNPTALQLSDMLNGARASTLLGHYQGAALQGKEVYVYYNYNNPYDCYISAQKLDNLDSIFRN